MYTTEAIAEFGEPTRLSSDRAPGIRNPISVNALHAGYEAGSYLRGEHRVRAMLDRDLMEERPLSYIDYCIDRPGLSELRGIVGILDLEDVSLHVHEGVMASAVAARSADIERAGAFLEPVVVATFGGTRFRQHGDGPALRQVRYGDEHHIISVVPRGFDHGLTSDTEFIVIDGHHRIAAARQHALLNDIEPSILALVVDVDSPGLFVVPQHRVLGGHQLDISALASNASIAPYRRGDTVAPGSVAFVGRTNSNVVSLAGVLPDDAGTRISSVTLEDYLIEPLDLWVQGFATKEADAYAELESGAAAVAIMGDLAMQDIVATATAGIVLPEKTTCFNPKVAVGLVGVTA